MSLLSSVTSVSVFDVPYSPIALAAGLEIVYIFISN